MADTEGAGQTAPSGRTHRDAQARRGGIPILFLAITAFLAVGLFLAYARHVGERAPSFDGAMNLQVAWSLAEGHGYRHGG